MYMCAWLCSGDCEGDLPFNAGDILLGFPSALSEGWLVSAWDKWQGHSLQITHTRTHAHTYAHTYAHTHARTHTHTHTHTLARMS